jgi:hypothetical protein
MCPWTLALAPGMPVVIVVVVLISAGLFAVHAVGRPARGERRRR